MAIRSTATRMLAYEEFYKVTMETIQKRGKVIVPAFAVGRTQEIVYALEPVCIRRAHARHPGVCRQPPGSQCLGYFPPAPGML